MNIILATRNPSKTEQIKNLFRGSSVSILTPTEAGIEGEAIEDGATLQENALNKALFVWEQVSSPKLWVAADDTGLFMPALNNEPGVRSARWAGDTATTEEIMLYTLNRLKDMTDRSATFETLVALISPEGMYHFFSGKVHGKILEAPRTKPQPKMPYSPIFVPDGTDQVWAEMSVGFENTISHRGIAFRQVRAFLESISK